MSRNITEVLLLRVPLESDYKHTLWFESKQAQEAYFKSKVVYTGLDFSYQRKDKVIRYPKDYDDLLGCNYVMYKNKDYTDKWYYAFITKMEYVNDGRTDIYIETDVIQSWMFDYTVQPSFVEREHTNNDTVGLHTVPESLEMGDFIINGIEQDDNLLPANGVVVMGSTIVPSELAKSIGGIYNGMYSGVKYYAYPVEQLGNLIQKVTDEFDDGAISSLFLAPEFLLGDYDGGVVEESRTPYAYSFNVPKKYGLDGYSPRNNKLKTSPFCYLLVSNGNGGTAEYCYEYFESESCIFGVSGVLTPGCSIRMIPTKYKGGVSPESEGLNLGKLPQCNWATDQYTNWLTQNGINVATGIASGVGSIALGFGASAIMPGMSAFASALVGGSQISGGINQIANTLNEVNKAMRQPPQTMGNTNCGDIVTARGDNTFTYYHMSIKKEYAQIIDSFFDMFGYKTNMVHIPLTNHRENFWYTKTIDVNIDGLVPMDDMIKIKSCYNNGITFWKNPKNIGNYSVSNKIV